MEVHHHPNVEKKGFKEYFLEFLMIFLAVTLGFLAENIREHISEQKTAEILAKSMFDDIKKDSASLHEAINWSNKKLEAVDGILSMMHKPHSAWNDTLFYKDMAIIFSSFPFAPTDGTYTQMKTSGTLRYFPQSLVNLMNAYDVQLKNAKYREDVEDKGIWRLADFNFNVMNGEVISDLRFNQPVTHEMYIKLNDKAAIDKYINLVVMIKSFRTRSLQEYKKQLEISDKLVKALKKEYQLE